MIRISKPLAGALPASAVSMLTWSWANSSGGQYFVATGPKVSALDGQGTYLNFGKVTQGMELVKQIAALYVPFPSTSPMAGLGGGPSEPVIINTSAITES